MKQCVNLIDQENKEKIILLEVNYQKLNNKTNRFENKTRVLKLKK